MSLLLCHACHWWNIGDGSVIGTKHCAYYALKKLCVHRKNYVHETFACTNPINKKKMHEKICGVGLDRRRSISSYKFQLFRLESQPSRLPKWLESLVILLSLENFCWKSKRTHLRLIISSGSS